MGFGCRAASNGGPGGGICARAAAALMNRTEKQATRYMAIIIINVVKSGTVRALFVKPEKGGKPIPLETADVSAAGLAGDYHTGSASRRQILLMSGAILDE